jgi:hypothetical protein
VWNNTGDKVILRRGDGSLKDTCSYPGEGASKYYCRNVLLLKRDQEQSDTLLPIAATARAGVGVLLGRESVDLVLQSPNGGLQVLGLFLLGFNVLD